MPRAAFLASRILHALLIAVVLVALTVAFGRALYHAEIPTGAALARFVLMLVVGSGTFCALELALTAIIPNADASAPIVNASILPLLFLSGILIPFGNNTASWILWVSRIFPVRHFAAGMQSGLVGTPFDWVDLVIVAAWGAAGILAAARYFRWEPSSN